MGTVIDWGCTAVVLLGLVGALPSLVSSEVTSPVRRNTAIFVTNLLNDSVTIYSITDHGNVAPSEIIGGDRTRLADPAGIARDAEGRIYVLNDYIAKPYNDKASSVTIYAAASRGNAAPTAVISGPTTYLFSVQGIAVGRDGSVYVGAACSNQKGDEGVSIFAPASNGNARPQRRIAGPATKIGNPYGIAVDSSGTIYVANVAGIKDTGVLVFPSMSNGNVAPAAIINGPKTHIDSPNAVALDSRGNIYLANAGRLHSPANITVYAPGSDGDVPPIAIIEGRNTGLNDQTVRGIALDDQDDIYVTSDGSDAIHSKISIFAAGSNGDVYPKAVIRGWHTKMRAAAGIVIGSYTTKLTGP